MSSTDRKTYRIALKLINGETIDGIMSFDEPEKAATALAERVERGWWDSQASIYVPAHSIVYAQIQGSSDEPFQFAVGGQIYSE